VELRKHTKRKKVNQLQEERRESTTGGFRNGSDGERIRTCERGGHGRGPKKEDGIAKETYIKKCVTYTQSGASEEKKRGRGEGDCLAD